MATYTFDKIEYGGNIYVPDFLPLAGGTVTGPVTFGDTITVDNATLGSLTVSESASVANNLQVNTINGVTVGNSPKFTDTIIDGVGALSKNGNNLQVNYNDGTAVRKINSINAATVSGISGVSILYDNGGDGGAVFLPDGNGFNTGSQNIINQIPSITLNGSANTSPSFYAPTGAGTSGQYLKSSGSGAPTWTNFPTIPSITLNGSSSTSPSFYAPTGAGTSGQYLKSSGSGAPTWTNFPTIPSITLNGSASTSPSFYAPTSAGTSGYYLKSNGSGAPTWAAISAGTDEKLALAEVTSETTYYPIVGTGTTAATRQYDTTGFVYFANSIRSCIELGNNISEGTTGSKRGAVRIYGTANKYTQLETTINSTGAGQSAGVVVNFPNKGGTVALTDDIPTIPSNNVTGSGTSGQLVQWNGTNTLTNGPKVTISTSTPSGGSNGDIWFVYS